jgi:hypothetical protein
LQVATVEQTPLAAAVTVISIFVKTQKLLQTFNKLTPHEKPIKQERGVKRFSCFKKLN